MPSQLIEHSELFYTDLWSFIYIYRVHTKHAYRAEFLSVLWARWWPRVVQSEHCRETTLCLPLSVVCVSGEMETRFCQRTRAVIRHVLARSSSFRENAGACLEYETSSCQGGNDVKYLFWLLCITGAFTLPDQGWHVDFHPGPTVPASVLSSSFA